METIDLNRFYIIPNNVIPIKSEDLINQLKKEQAITVAFGILSVAVAVAAIIINEYNKTRYEAEKQFN